MSSKAQGTSDWSSQPKILSKAERSLSYSMMNYTKCRTFLLSPLFFSNEMPTDNHGWPVKLTGNSTLSSPSPAFDFSRTQHLQFSWSTYCHSSLSLPTHISKGTGQYLPSASSFPWNEHDLPLDPKATKVKAEPLEPSQSKSSPGCATPQIHWSGKAGQHTGSLWSHVLF